MKVMGFDPTALKIIGAYFLILALIAAFGCSQGTTVPSDDDDDDCDDPPIEDCYFEETEPNGTFGDANFVDLLPVLGSYTFCGDFEDIGIDITDTDFLYFFLNPNPGDTEILINLIVETDTDITPTIHLWQTVYDALGEPTDTYQSLGTFFGSDGMLLILDFPIPFDFMTNNDLFVQLEAAGTLPLSYHEYTMEYYTE